MVTSEGLLNSIDMAIRSNPSLQYKSGSNTFVIQSKKVTGRIYVIPNTLSISADLRGTATSINYFCGLQGVKPSGIRATIDNLIKYGSIQYDYTGKHILQPEEIKTCVQEVLAEYSRGYTESIDDCMYLCEYYGRNDSVGSIKGCPDGYSVCMRYGVNEMHLIASPHIGVSTFKKLLTYFTKVRGTLR